MNFGENWISLDPNADYVTALRGDRRGAGDIPRPVRRGPDLPRRAGRGGPHRRQGADHRPRLRRGPEDASATCPQKVLKELVRDRRREGRAHATSRRTCRRSRSTVKLAKAREARHQAGRRPACRGDPRGRRGGRRHLPQREGLRHGRVEHTGGTGTATRSSAPADRHAVRQAGPARRRGHGPVRPTPTRSSARATPGHRVGRRVEGRTSDRWSARSAAVRCHSPAATTPRCSASTTSGRPPRTGCSRPAVIAGLPSCCCCGLVPQLAAGGSLFLTLPMALVGGVLRVPGSAAGSSPSARWWASSPSSASPPATASC